MRPGQDHREDGIGHHSSRRPVAHHKRPDLECGQCQHRFSKPEHLARHTRVHSGIKPYRCTHLGCEKHFSRMDSLARHAKMHNKETEYATQQGSGHAQAPITPGSDVQSTVDGLPNMLEEDPPLELAQLSGGNMLTDDATMSYPMASYSWPDIDALFAILISETHVADQQANGPPDHARRAVQSLSSLLQEFSSDLARDVEGLGVTSDFLDACLGCFFEHFHPIFPVIHKPTFTVSECTPILLLTMIAIGSLFLAAEGVTAKGEALWKIAQAVSANSWQRLLANPPPNETVPGKQLLLTSLLGQAYAVLSANDSLRLSGQALRGLGFYWIRHTVGLVGVTKHEKPLWRYEALNSDQRWRTWAAEEMQRRAVLWHYVLDGVISQSSRVPNGIRHTINNMPLPCSDLAFEAGTAEDWLSLIAQESQTTSTTCRELLLQLFTFQAPLPRALWSHVSIPVVMEALQSLITETQEAGGPSIGLPCRNDISQALWRLFDSQIKHDLQPAVVCLDLSIRWHTVCIGLCADPITLLQGLRSKEAARQDCQDGNSTALQSSLCLKEWQASHLARRALLHAIAAIESLRKLPLGNMHSLHIPLSLDIIGTIVLAADAIDGTNTIRLPETVCWKSVCDLNSKPHDSCTSTTLFIHHGSVSSNFQASNQNFTVLLNALHSLRASRTSTWGVTRGMESVDRLLRARLQRT